MRNNGIRTLNFLHSSRAYYYSCLSTYWATEDLHAMIIIYRLIRTIVLPAVLLFFSEWTWMNE